MMRVIKGGKDEQDPNRAKISMKCLTKILQCSQDVFESYLKETKDGEKGLNLTLTTMSIALCHIVVNAGMPRDIAIDCYAKSLDHVMWAKKESEKCND